jgi:GNAT superfamily N-acetyltransferase
MIRRATSEEIDAIGEVFAAARAQMTYLPPIPDGDRRRIGRLIALRCDELWVAERDGEIAGFAGLKGDMLEHLYVRPDLQRSGLGAALLDHAKARRPDGLRLWVFQRNEDARRFYERQGFRLVRLTDGAANMEKEPDALYEWTSSS